jgi:ATP-dependent helicase/nuclease subunit A
VTFTPVDHAERDRIRDSLDESLCIEAGAGTGKTTALVSRVVNVLRRGRASVDEIVVITFTEAAAAELAGRVRESLEDALETATDADERARIHDALSGLYRARIETIHAFCGSLLRERPVEAGLDPAFEIADELADRLRFETAYSDWQTALLSGDSPEIKIATNRGIGLDGVRDVVGVVNGFREILPLDLPAVVPADVDGFVTGYHTIADELRPLRECAAKDPAASPQIDEILRFDELLREAADDREWLERSILYAAPYVRKNAGSQKHWEDRNDCRETKRLFVKLREAIEEIQPAMRNEALAGLLPLAQEFVLAEEERRRGEGVADFDDLLIWARNLLRDRPEAREYFRERFKVVFIDEFQDTDPVQAELALLLTSSDPPGDNLLALRPRPGALTVVGDPKQSIYRFRRADIAVYDAVRNGPLAGAAPQLAQNFRSTTGVIDWLNEVFDRVLEEVEGVQPANVPLVPADGKLEDESRSICVVRAEPAEKAEEARRNEAQLIAATIRRAIDEDWTVRDSDGSERPAEYRDVAILFPARTGLDLFEEALRRSGIPYRVEGGRSFFARQEVRDLSAVLAAVDDPLDQVSLVAALRSAAFGCSDDELYLHVARGGRLDYRSDGTASPEAVREAFETLVALHRRKAGVSLSRLVRETVERLRMIEVALAGWDGQQAAANLAKLVEQSRAFSARGGGGLRAFARWLAEQRGTYETENAGVAEAADDAVRLVTMHASKGLEYPIVMLANLGTQPNRRVEPVVDRARRKLELRISSRKKQFATAGFEAAWEHEKVQLDAEELRLLYVAATRARDRLIIPISYAKRPGPRLAALMDSLPDEEAPLETETDGLYLIDAAMLPPLAEDEPPAATAPAEAEVEAEMAARDVWERKWVETLEDARAELAIHPATKDEGDDPVPAAFLGADDAPLIAGEGPPAEKGEAMHRILELVDLRNPHDLEEVARSVCTVAGLDDHLDEILDLCRACLESEALARALGSKHVWREVPYTVAVEDGYATGRIDLVFGENGELVVLDWKSDTVGPKQVQAAAESHRPQAEAYAQSLTASTKRPVSEVLFFFPRAGRAGTLRVDLA